MTFKGKERSFHVHQHCKGQMASTCVFQLSLFCEGRPKVPPCALHVFHTQAGTRVEKKHSVS